MEILKYISFGVGVIGVAIILWGAILTFFRFIRLEYCSLKGKRMCTPRESLRHRFGSYLLFGLEFLIAADIVHTITKPTLKDIAVLGSIVAIRTVISYFLDRELADASHFKQDD
ncbi:DUF1622 domain-containing protein [bacterium]|nr:DUF1622 domain-containing protein [bacterium]